MEVYTLQKDKQSLNSRQLIYCTTKLHSENMGTMGGGQREKSTHARAVAR